MIFAQDPQFLPVNDALEEALEALPQAPAVFIVWPREGSPYIGKTGVLRRRLKRLFRTASQPSRLLNLRSIADRIEYWPVASGLQGLLVLWDVAREHAPETYTEILKLRFPSYVKLILSNQFPRTQVTTRLGGVASQYVGPFRSRGSAEVFEHQFLDLFQLRRCQEDLSPTPDHPGCMYGEMNMCLRPCQQAVGPEEYLSEAQRVSQFLRQEGQPMLRNAEASRERLSAELDFEAAAREHKRIERIETVLKLRDELVNDIDRMHGVAVTASTLPHEVLLWFLTCGAWHPPVAFSVALADQAASMDRRLKDIVSGIVPQKVAQKERQEHLAMLARWFYSSWRDGEWIPIPILGGAPYRKVIGAISRVARRQPV